MGVLGAGILNLSRLLFSIISHFSNLSRYFLSDLSRSKVIKSKDSLSKGISGFKDTLNKGFLNFSSPKYFLNSVKLDAYIRESRIIIAYPSDEHSRHMTSLYFDSIPHGIHHQTLRVYNQQLHLARECLAALMVLCRQLEVNPIGVRER